MYGSTLHRRRLSDIARHGLVLRGQDREVVTRSAPAARTRGDRRRRQGHAGCALVQRAADVHDGAVVVGGFTAGDLLDELLAEVRRRGDRVLTFGALVQGAEALVGAAHPDGLLGWKPGSAW